MDAHNSIEVDARAFATLSAARRAELLGEVVKAARDRALEAARVACVEISDRALADVVLSLALPIARNASCLASALSGASKPARRTAHGREGVRVFPRSILDRALLPGISARAFLGTSEAAAVARSNLAAETIADLFDDLARDDAPPTPRAFPARALLALEILLAPLAAASALRFVARELPAVAIAERPMPVFVVPYLYAADELAYQAKDVAASLAFGASFARPDPAALVVARGWPQHGRFVASIEAELVASQVGGAAGAFEVVEVAADEPLAFLRAASEANAALALAHPAARVVVHPAYADDPPFAAELFATIAAMRARVVAVNQDPRLLEAFALRALARSAGVAPLEKIVVQGPLRSLLAPPHALNRARPLDVALRVLDAASAPSLGAAARRVKAAVGR